MRIGFAQILRFAQDDNQATRLSSRAKRRKENESVQSGEFRVKMKMAASANPAILYFSLFISHSSPGRMDAADTDARPMIYGAGG